MKTAVEIGVMHAPSSNAVRRQGTDPPRASGGSVALPTSQFQPGETDFGLLFSGMNFWF